MADYMNLETGEVFGNAVIVSQEQRKARREYRERREQVEGMKYMRGKENFVLYLFNMHKSMIDLQPQNAIRLVYLATYLEFDGKFLRENGRLLTRQKMQDLLAIKQTTFKNFLSEVTNAGYFIKDGKTYYLNTKHFYKGKIDISEIKKNKNFIRIYVDSLRKLYLATPQNKHIYLGYIFQLIPYINREYNVICYNPDETVEEYIEPMSVGDFCEIIGYSRDHAARFIKEYRNITFEWAGREQRFLGYYYEENKEDMSFFANPNIFFAGNDFNKVKILKLAFSKNKDCINKKDRLRELRKLLHDPEFDDLY